jgi:hypothetical protein
MLFLYNLPNWLLGIVIVGGLVVASYVIYSLVHRLWRPTLTEEDIQVAIAVLGAVATINSLLLAFSAVSVWESFSSAEEAVVAEANTVGALSRDLATYNSVESREARRLLREYVSMVINVEWPEMQRGRASTEVWIAFDRTFAAVAALEPDTPRERALFSEILARTNELLTQRRRRLFTSESEIPGTLWSVTVIGTVLTILTAFALPPTRLHLLMIGVLVVSVGLVFFLLVAMDRPFAGDESISPGPFISAVENMSRWDVR